MIVTEGLNKMTNDSRDSMAEKLASTLLYYESSQVDLINKVWEEFTPDQKKDLADAAHAAAMSRVKAIVDTRIQD